MRTNLHSPAGDESNLTYDETLRLVTEQVRKAESRFLREYSLGPNQLVKTWTKNG